MTGGLMMKVVARPVPNVIGPAYERIQHLEEEIQVLRLEDRPVLKLVNGDQSHEGSNSSVNEQRNKKQRNRPVPIRTRNVEESKIGQNCGCEEQPQVQQSLKPPLEVIALHELLQQFTVNGGAIPADLDVVVKRIVLGLWN